MNYMLLLNNNTYIDHFIKDIMKNDKDEILKAKTELEKAQEKLLETYLSSIRADYHKFPGRRDFILEKLDDFVKGLERVVMPLYDREIAKKIRKEAGLSQQELAQKIEIDKLGYVKISRFESGKRIPGNPPQGETARKYLEWLKGHGYNPYDI